MSEYIGNLDSTSNRSTIHYAVTSGVTVTEGDEVYLVDGRVTNASIAGKALIGHADGTGTGDAGGSVSIPVIVDPSAKFLMTHDNVGVTFAGATDVGQYYDLTGATGAQLIDTSTESATTGQVFVIDYVATEGTTKCVVVIAERQGRK